MLLDDRVARRTHVRDRPGERVETTMATRYVGPMPVTANQVAAALGTFLPELEGAKLPRLLSYVQGHQLAFFGRPAFAEAVVAGANGPEIKGFQDARQPHQRGVLD